MARLNIYTRFNLSMLACAGALLFGLALLVFTPASAQTTCAMVRCGSGTTCVDTPQGAVCQMPAPRPAITCANVRCAGTCTDTSAGPVCGPPPPPQPEPLTLSCANVLCSQGMRCVETRSGPQCVSQGTYPPKSHPGYDWKNQSHTHEHTHPHGGHDHNGDHDHGDQGHNNGQMCPMVYQPVCAEKIVQCVRAPCPPEKRTFGNSCEAARDGYTVKRQGVCN